MEDRLQDLKFLAENTSKLCSFNEFALDQPTLLGQFSFDAYKVQTMLFGISSQNSKISQYIKKVLNSAIPSTYTEKDSDESLEVQIQKMINQNQKECAKAKKQILILEKEVQEDEVCQIEVIEDKGEPSVIQENPLTRFKRMNVSALKERFFELLLHFQSMQVDYQIKCQENVKRQIKNIDKDLDDKQIEEIADDPMGPQRLIISKLGNNIPNALVNRICDIQEKHKDILKLKQNVEVVHEMMEQIGMMVDQQGIQLDIIEGELNKTRDYMTKSVKILENEQKIQKKNRKKQCAILIIVLIIIILIVVPTSILA